MEDRPGSDQPYTPELFDASVYDIIGSQPGAPQRRQERPGRTLAAGFAGALGGGLVTVAALAAGGVFDRTPDVQAVPVIRTATVAAATPAGNVVNAGAVARTVLPSIVTVNVEGFHGSGSGSGVVFRSDGFIVTNHHVIETASSIDVEFLDGVRYPATLIGSDPLTDIAVLKVDRIDLAPLAAADLPSLGVGEAAIAIGNPLGLRGGPSVTTGVVSALDRTLRVDDETLLYGLVQTDAPITRGSSGGALVDGSGSLIGITTAIGVSDVGAEGLGFVVPADLMIGVADDLISQGEVHHAFLGIRGGTATETAAGGVERPVGALITSLLDGSAIASAGARPGDVIVALDGTHITSLDGLISLLRHRRAGDSVTASLLRSGDTIDLDFRLGEFPP